jgi:hypothetical protein
VIQFEVNDMGGHYEVMVYVDCALHWTSDAIDKRAEAVALVSALRSSVARLHKDLRLVTKAELDAMAIVWDAAIEFTTGSS